MEDYFLSNTNIVKKIDTIHYFHTTGWTARVYGARHLDFVDDCQTLEDMYREYRKSLTKNEERTESQEPHAFRLMRKYKQFKHPSMEFLGLSIEKFGNKYLQHFSQPRQERCSTLKWVQLPTRTPAFLTFASRPSLPHSALTMKSSFENLGMKSPPKDRCHSS